jgi:hypothetical protein
MDTQLVLIKLRPLLREAVSKSKPLNEKKKEGYTSKRMVNNPADDRELEIQAQTLANYLDLDSRNTLVVNFRVISMGSVKSLVGIEESQFEELLLRKLSIFESKLTSLTFTIEEHVELPEKPPGKRNPFVFKCPVQLAHLKFNLVCEGKCIATEFRDAMMAVDFGPILGRECTIDQVSVRLSIKKQADESSTMATPLIFDAPATPIETIVISSDTPASLDVGAKFKDEAPTLGTVTQKTSGFAVIKIIHFLLSSFVLSIFHSNE